MQQQLETKKNRERNQQYLEAVEEQQEESSKAGQYMSRMAKGGVALTITASPEDSNNRSRSGSKPRYPYQDQEPFQVNQRPNMEENPYYQPPYQVQQRPRSNYQQRVPRELHGIGSTIKSKVEQDRMQYQERRRLSDSREEQQVQPQIFYKKNDQMVQYEDGQETYRHPSYIQKQKS